MIYYGKFDYFALEFLMTVAELEWFYKRLVEEKQREEQEARKLAAQMRGR